MRVKFDVPVTPTIYLDGADTQEKSAYEYLAPGEPTLGLKPGTQQIAGYRVLVISGTDRRQLESLADAFLRSATDK
jgi:hypothetical protein